MLLGKRQDHIDGLDPAFAPGTGTPVCGGMSTDLLLKVIRGLVGMELVGMDVVEVNPAYDHGDITSLAAATLGLELLYLLAAGKQTRRAGRSPLAATARSGPVRHFLA